MGRGPKRLETPVCGVHQREAGKKKSATTYSGTHLTRHSPAEEDGKPGVTSNRALGAVNFGYYTYM